MEKPVDDVLSQWESYITNIGSNLMELSEETEYQLIKARAKDTANGYTGLTKVKADKCVETMGTLWIQFSSLSEVIEKAKDLKSKHSFLFNSDEAVKELLDTTLIVVESEHVDIDERDLLSSENSDKKATPKELLRLMRESFESLRDDITQISEAEESLQRRLSDIKDEISRLNCTVKRLGIANVPEFDIDKVTKIESDPLQGHLELDRLVYSIEKYRASIRDIEEDYDKIISAFDKIKQMISELKDMSEKSKTILLESGKIFGDTVSARPVISREVLKSLEEWLQVLEDKLSKGSLNAVKIGVSKLQKECSFKLDIERENYHFNSDAYNEWLDLKGQFKALLVKAEVLKDKGLLIDSSLDGLIEDTRTAIYKVPVDLDNCRELVRKFELSL